MLDYHANANQFLQQHGITFQATYLYHGPLFDEEVRAVWKVNLIRGNKVGFTTQFGQSLVNSFGKVVENCPGLRLPNGPKLDKTRQIMKPPTAYDLLATITKNDPGTFAEFCSDFGYNDDSIKAQQTYFKVQEEWVKVRSFFTPLELEALQDIC